MKSVAVPEYKVGERVQVRPENENDWVSGTVVEGLRSKLYDDDHPSVVVCMDDTGKEETYWLDQDEVVAHIHPDT